MGIPCSCYDTRTSDKETTILFQKINDQQDRFNRSLEQVEFYSVKDPVSRCTTPLLDITQEKSLNISKFDADKRVLNEDEGKSIDISDFFFQDDISSLNLKSCIEGVYCCPAEIYELNQGIIYKGEFDEEGLQHGRGFEVWSDGTKYLGYYYHGNIQGEGRLSRENGVICQGNFITIDPQAGRSYENVVLHGAGKEIWPNGVKYEGEFHYGKKNGKGRLECEEWEYSGQFAEDEMHGEGTMIWKNGNKYIGEWAKGMKNGKGKFKYANGKSYNGEFLEDEKHGQGEMKFRDGKIYDGQWVNGKQNGTGIFSYFDKSKQRVRSGRSEWKDGTKLRWLSPYKAN